MREQFEKLPDIAERLNQGGVYWDGEKYTPKPFMSNFMSTAIFLNGAWYAYQEQQKKIDKALELGYEKRGNVHYLVDEHIDEIQGVLE